MSLVKIFVYLNDSNHITINNTLMSKNIISFDIEYNSAREELTQIAYWSNCEPEPHFYKGNQVEKGREEFIAALKEANVLVGHNIKEWDLPKLNIEIGSEVFIWDTLEVERVLNTVRQSYSLLTTHDAMNDTINAYNLFCDQVYRISNNQNLKFRFITFFGREINVDELPEKDFNSDFFSDNIYCEESLSKYLNNKIEENQGANKIRIICPRIFWKELSLCRQDIVFQEGDINYQVIDKNKIKSLKESDNKWFLQCFVDDCEKEYHYSPIFSRIPYYWQCSLKKELSGDIFKDKDARIICIDPSEEHGPNDGYVDIPLFGSINQLYSEECVSTEVDNDESQYFVIPPEIEYRALQETHAKDRLPNIIKSFLLANSKKGNTYVFVYNETVPIENEVYASLYQEGIYVPQYNQRDLSLFKLFDLANRKAPSNTAALFITDEDMSERIGFRLTNQYRFVFLSWNLFNIGICWYQNNSSFLVRLSMAIYRRLLGTLGVDNEVLCYLDYNRTTSSDAKLNQPSKGVFFTRKTPEKVLEQIKDYIIGKNSSWRTEEKDGYDQKKYVETILEAKANDNYFVTIPTGGGKSVLFQGPSLYKYDIYKKLSLVISPLLALMNDQVTSLQSKGFSGRVACINSEKSSAEKREILTGITDGIIGLLYLSPEQLLNCTIYESIKKRLNNDGGLGYLIFDEAHCISHWGDDFRPLYKVGALMAMKLIKENPCPMLFFSATLSGLMKNSIKGLNEGLKIEDISNDQDSNIIRENVKIQTVALEKVDNLSEEKEEHLLAVSNTISSLLSKITNPEKSRIVIFYDNKNNCKYCCNEINKSFPDDSPLKGRIGYYSSELDTIQKKSVINRFKNGELLAILTTKAFGMGIDLPNIHYVIHAKVPSSLEDYVQEVGRAGRDTESLSNAGLKFAPAYCIINDEQKNTNSGYDLENSLNLQLEYLRNTLGADFKGETILDFSVVNLNLDQLLAELEQFSRLDCLRRIRSGFGIRIKETNIEFLQDEECKKFCQNLKSNINLADGFSYVSLSDIYDTLSLPPQEIDKVLSKCLKAKVIEINQELHYSWRGNYYEVEYFNRKDFCLRLDVMRDVINDVLDASKSQTSILEDNIKEIVSSKLRKQMGSDIVLGEPLLFLHGRLTNNHKLPWWQKRTSADDRKNKYTTSVTDGAIMAESYYKIVTESICNAVFAYLTSHSLCVESGNKLLFNHRVIRQHITSEKLGSYYEKSKFVLNKLLEASEIASPVPLSINISSILDKDNINISYEELFNIKNILENLGLIKFLSSPNAYIVNIKKISELTPKEKLICSERKEYIQKKCGLVSLLMNIKQNNPEFDICSKASEYYNIDSIGSMNNFRKELEEKYNVKIGEDDVVSTDSE